MRYRTIFDGRFDEDAAEARAWYESEHPNLGEEFEHELQRCVSAVMERPLSFPIARRGMRRALLKRFPYIVIFKVKDDLLLIAGVFHAARDRGVWDTRG